MTVTDNSVWADKHPAGFRRFTQFKVAVNLAFCSQFAAYFMCCSYLSVGKPAEACGLRMLYWTHLLQYFFVFMH